jgi:hypothetical protein
MITMARTADATATRRPHQRAIEYMPNATPACWNRAKSRSTYRSVPNTL